MEDGQDLFILHGMTKSRKAVLEVILLQWNRIEIIRFFSKTTVVITVSLQKAFMITEHGQLDCKKLVMQLLEIMQKH